MISLSMKTPGCREGTNTQGEVSVNLPAPATLTYSYLLHPHSFLTLTDGPGVINKLNAIVNHSWVYRCISLPFF